MYIYILVMMTSSHSLFQVRRLHRVAFGPQHLGDLAPGKCRALNAEEVDALYAVCKTKVQGQVPLDVESV